MVLVVLGSLAGVIVGQLGTSRIFAWQMFPETSTRHAEIVRVTTQGDVVDISAPWPGGYRWPTLVEGTGMESVTVPGAASYGVDVTTERLQRTLDWVALHTPDDHETVRLEATLWTSRNGRPEVSATLVSVERPVAPAMGHRDDGLAGGQS